MKSSMPWSTCQPRTAAGQMWCRWAGPHPLPPTLLAALLHAFTQTCGCADVLVRAPCSCATCPAEQAGLLSEADPLHDPGH
jgi:hypothetical protein